MLILGLFKKGSLLAFIKYHGTMLEDLEKFGCDSVSAFIDHGKAITAAHFLHGKTVQ